MATAKKTTRPARASAKKSPARKAPAKAPRKAAPARAPKVVTQAIPLAAARPDKPKKPKLVRDSFTIPKVEYAVIDTLKQRAAKAGLPAKKSEILRAGIKVLAAMGDATFLAAMADVPAIKTGRPAGN